MWGLGTGSGTQVPDEARGDLTGIRAGVWAPGRGRASAATWGVRRLPWGVSRERGGHVPLPALLELGETVLVACEEPSGKGRALETETGLRGEGPACVVTATGGGEAAGPAGSRHQGPTEARSAGRGTSARQRAVCAGGEVDAAEKQGRPGGEAAPGAQRRGALRRHRSVFS